MIKNLIFLFHLYQPSTQDENVLRLVTAQTYRPLFELLLQHPQVKVVLNINASLTEQWKRVGEEEVLLLLKKLLKRQQIELTTSAKYHPLLSRLPLTEIKHQIYLNNESHYRLLDPDVKLKGFFPPELAFNSLVAQALSELGLQWVVLEDIAFPQPSQLNFNFFYQISETSLKAFFRHKGLSLALAFGHFRKAAEFYQACKESDDAYALIALDGETFGHHHPEALFLLADIFALDLPWNTLTGLLEENKYPVQETTVLPSTWGMMKKEGQWRIFPRWDNPHNPIHQRQWQLFYLALSLILRCQGTEEGYLETRIIFDQAVQSDQFFWAAGDPCWHPGMVAKGADLLLEAIRRNPVVSKEEVIRGEILRQEIREIGFKLFGNKIILA